MSLEIYFRSARLFKRLFSKPISITSYRAISNIKAVNEDVNSELLKSFNQDIKAASDPTNMQDKEDTSPQPHFTLMIPGGVVPVFRRALLFPNRIALQDDFATYTYADLYEAAAALSKDIGAQLLGDTERTITYMCQNDATHVITQWAIWMSGNIAVPLTPLHPPDMLKYFITDSDARLVICSEDFEKDLRPIAEGLSKPLLSTGRSEDLSREKAVPSDIDVTNKWYGNNDAMLIYTSGTTSKPKGVVWSHGMLSAQIAALHSAWCYSAQDVVLHALPLHHIHGQLNSLNASLAAGAKIRMLPKFASHEVWARLLDRDDRVSVFHGVPAMYGRLADDHARMFADEGAAAGVRSILSGRMRLMCSGSAPLPETLFRKWEQISGLRLLERYGMSETGMALSNPYRPAGGRAPGLVGLPLPGVAARVARFEGGAPTTVLTAEGAAPDPLISLDKLGLTSDRREEDVWTTSVTEHEHEDCHGELLLKGPAVFTRYWNRAPSALSSDFTSDGWFRTGDTVSFSDGTFKIMGRTSIDIIKTSGYKVSALQIESAILEHPDISDVAVLGVPDQRYGEIVSAVVVLKENASLTLKELKEEAGKKLAPYQLPKTMLIVDLMPRNAMGKLDKKVIRQKFEEKLFLKE